MPVGTAGAAAACRVRCVAEEGRGNTGSVAGKRFRSFDFRDLDCVRTSVHQVRTPDLAKRTQTRNRNATNVFSFQRDAIKSKRRPSSWQSPCPPPLSPTPRRYPLCARPCASAVGPLPRTASAPGRAPARSPPSAERAPPPPPPPPPSPVVAPVLPRAAGCSGRAMAGVMLCKARGARRFRGAPCWSTDQRHGGA